MSLAPATLTFLRKLRRNNDREWFRGRVEPWEAARADFLGLIAELAGPMGRVSGFLFCDAGKTGGSMLRLHRDVRFSKDKRPYKTHLAALFDHVGVEGKLDSPCVYLHVEPGGKSFVAGGLYGPSTADKLAVRRRIVQQPAAWRRAVKAAEEGRMHLVDGSLKRPPRVLDVAADHPLMPDLMRQRWAASSEPIDDRDVTDDGFAERVAAYARATKPLNTFLCDALGLPF